MPTEEKNKIGWVSPQFTETRTVSCDPQVLAENRCVSAFPEREEGEIYKMLRTQLLQVARKKGGNTIMITSAHPGEGKTLTAINLAVTMTKEFKETALLVDCDLRTQQIHHYFGVESDRNLIDYLVDDIPIKDVLFSPGIEKLTIISGAKTVMDSSELLSSERMQDLVTEMKNRYPDRYIFFDVPPVLWCADALAFSPLVDHVLMVIRAGATSIQDVKKALGFFPKEKIIGLVLNWQKNEEVKLYNYNYKYKYKNKYAYSPREKSAKPD